MNHLVAQERATDEMLVRYFMNGLRKELRHAVSRINIAIGLNDLVDIATRAKKRYGLNLRKKARRRS